MGTTFRGQYVKQKAKKFQELLIDWGPIGWRDFSWRYNRTPYRVFIAEMLLKRTTSVAVSRIYDDFLSYFPNIKKIFDSDITVIEEFIRPIGLYKQRSKGLKESSEYIITKLSGVFPSDFNSLLQIPHVGPYAAGCILSFGMGIPAPTVDSNVSRVIRRVFSEQFEGNPKFENIFNLTSNLIDESSHVQENYALIDLGSTICSYRGCYAHKCPLVNICSSNREMSVKILYDT